jgi:tetratricopeptide (TPR) repeat protein
VVLIAATILVFGQCATFGWTNWDDQLHVTENPKFQPTAFSHLFDFWREPFERLYIPLTYMLFAVETWLGRLLVAAEPVAVPPASVFHVTSIALHIGCVLLVWRLLTALVARPWPATAGAVLFAIHPLQVESVAWISEQRGLLAGLFSFAALYCRWWALQSDEGRRRRLSAAAFLMMVAAVLSKPSAMTLPLLAGAIDLLALKAPWRRVVHELAPWFALSLIVAAGTKFLQPDAIVADRPSLWLRPFIAGDALAFYAMKLFVPLNLGIDHGRTPAFVLSDSLACAVALGMLAALGLAFGIFAWRAWRLPVTLFVAPLLPVLGLVPFSFQHVSTVAERYAYVAMLGPSLGLAMLVSQIARAGRYAEITKGTIVAGLSALGAASVVQAGSWRDCETLYGQAIRANPISHHARNNLGTALLDAGRLDRAAEYLQQSVARKPDFAKSRFNLATCLHRLGRRQAAFEHYEAALGLDPAHADAHNNLGILFAEEGRMREAIHHFQSAIAIREYFPDAQRNLYKAMQSLENKVDADTATVPGAERDRVTP